jgi:hypothetical protein
MASPNQLAANRQNALRSTGPVTAPGKAAASQNALRHGLTSTRIVIPGEDPAGYDALREDLLRLHAPANAIERALVEELAAASWRLQRARRVETAVLTKWAADAPDPDAAIAAALLEKPKELDRLLRYITAHERAFYRAMDKLAKAQKERKAAEHAQALEQTWLEGIRESRRRECGHEKSNGFVSQTPAPATVNFSALPETEPIANVALPEAALKGIAAND